VPEPPAFYNDPCYRAFISALGRVHKAHYGNNVSGALEQWMKHDLKRLVTSIEPPVVDLGCGAGGGFDVLGGANHIIGVDAQLDLLQSAKKLYPHATLVRSTLEDLPFLTGSVPCVFAIAVMEHVYHLERTLQNVVRFLAPGGRFYVMVPTEGGLAVEVARLLTSWRNGALIGLSPAESRKAQRKDHCNTVFAIENALRKHFVIEKSAAWPFRHGGATLNLTKSYRLAPFRA
jgi:SAM-dependent methyltransferase